MATLVRWDPLREVAALQNEMSRFMNVFRGDAGNGTTAQSWVPPLDVWETDNDIVYAFDLPGIADNHVLDFAPAVEHHADLAAGVTRDLGEMASQLRRAELARLDAAAVGREEAPGLAGLQSRGIAVQIVSRTFGPLRAVSAPSS